MAVTHPCRGCDTRMVHDDTTNTTHCPHCDRGCRVGSTCEKCDRVRSWFPPAA